MSLRSRTDVGVVAPLDGISLGSPGRAVHDCVGPEVPVPQAKPRLVRLASCRVGVRPGQTERCVRTEILAVLDELVDSDGILA